MRDFFVTDVPRQPDVTSILSAAAAGDSRAAADLLPLVYDELRRLAKARMARTPPGHTLQPTALVHEAYLRLIGDADPGWANRGHFFAAAALSMRQILVDYARQKGSLKRGGDRGRADAEKLDSVVQAAPEDVVAIAEAVERLESTDPRKGQIVNMRYFAGFTVEETAQALGVSIGTIEREWRYIKRWLYVELSDERGAQE
jgi:RNA polymerase sigma factor (TIGR02999 family)